MKSIYKDIFIFLQILLVFISVVLLTMSFFIEEFMLVTYIVLALLLFVIAINNHIGYKRKFMTPIYFIMGLLVLGMLFV